jgi:RND superfamily putative drug exporter
MLAIAAPGRIVSIALFVTVVAAIFGVPVANSLSASGFQDPNSGDITARSGGVAW